MCLHLSNNLVHYRYLWLATSKTLESTTAELQRRRHSLAAASNHAGRIHPSILHNHLRFCPQEDGHCLACLLKENHTGLAFINVDSQIPPSLAVENGRGGCETVSGAQMILGSVIPIWMIYSHRPQHVYLSHHMHVISLPFQ